MKLKPALTATASVLLFVFFFVGLVTSKTFAAIVFLSIGAAFLIGIWCAIYFSQTETHEEPDMKAILPLTFAAEYLDKESVILYRYYPAPAYACGDVEDLVSFYEYCYNNWLKPARIDLITFFSETVVWRI